VLEGRQFNKRICEELVDINFLSNATVYIERIT
jgi:hypothetical protein